MCVRACINMGHVFWFLEMHWIVQCCESILHAHLPSMLQSKCTRTAGSAEERSWGSSRYSSLLWCIYTPWPGGLAASVAYCPCSITHWGCPLFPHPQGSLPCRQLPASSSSPLIPWQPYYTLLIHLWVFDYWDIRYRKWNSWLLVLTLLWLNLIQE